VIKVFIKTYNASAEWDWVLASMYYITSSDLLMQGVCIHD